MLGQNHESILDLVIRDARGVLEFLGIDLPKDAVIATDRGLDLSESIPKQLLADGRIVIGKPPILGLVLEAQSNMSETDWNEKKFKWPHFAIGLRTELRRMTETLVITTDPRIERLAREPIQIGWNSWWRAMVLGPTLPLWIAQMLKEDPMTQQYYSPIVLDYVEQGRIEGREEGLEEGREEGLETGLGQKSGQLGSRQRVS